MAEPNQIPEEVIAEIRDAHTRLKTNPQDKEAGDLVELYQKKITEGKLQPIDLKVVAEDQRLTKEFSATKPSSFLDAVKGGSITAPEAFLRKFGDSATGGLSTLATAGINSLLKGTNITDEAKILNAEMENISARFPKLSIAGDILGYVNPAGLYGMVTKGASKAVGKAGARKAASLIGGELAGTGATEATRLVTDIASDKKTLETATDDLLHNMALGAGASVTFPLISRTMNVTAGGIRKATEKVLSGPGLNPESIALYMANPSGVRAMMKQKLDDFLPRFSGDFNAKIRRFVGQSERRLNDIVIGIKDPINIQPIIDSLTSELRRLGAHQTTPKRSAAVSAIREQLDNIFASSQDGLASADYVLNLRRDLQEAATDYYTNAAFKAPKIGKAFNEAANTANGVLGRANPEILDITEKMDQVISGQKAMGLGRSTSKRGLNPKKAPRVMFDVTAPSSQGNIQAIEQMDKLADTNVLPTARIYRAAQEIGSKDILSRSTTGRSTLRGQVAQGIGGLTGKVIGVVLESPPIQKGVMLGAEGLARTLEQVGKTPARAILPIERR